MEDWNAIDLHMHTLSGVTGDGKRDEVKNFSYLNYIKTIKKFDLKLTSITNHNIINIKNYIICRFLSKMIDNNTLLGVEIDTDNKFGKNYHFVIVFKESLNSSIKIAEKINELTSAKMKSGKVRFTADEIVDFVKKYNLIIIPHGDKSKGLIQRPTEEEIVDALKKVRDGFIRVFDSPSDWKLAKIKQIISENQLYDNIDSFGGVLFSDNRDWCNYNRNFRDFYMNAEPTFNGFLHSITNPTQRFSTKEFIPKHTNYISRIEIKSKNNNSRIKDCSIYLKSGYNCIIGKSGSGKSLLLHIIKKQLKNVEITNSYTFLENNDVKIYNENNYELNSLNVNIGIGTSIFNKIIQASDSSNANNMYDVAVLLNKNFIPKKKITMFKEQYKKIIKDYTNKKTEFKRITETINEYFIAFKSINMELKKLKDVIPFSIECPDENKLDYTDEDISKLSLFDKKIKELQEIVLIIKNNEFVGELISKILELKEQFNFKLKEILKERCQKKLLNKKIEIIKNALVKVNATLSNNSKRKQDIINSIGSNIQNIVSLLKNRYLINLRIHSFDLTINLESINNTEIFDESEGISISETIDEKNIKQMDIKANNLFYTRGIQTNLTSQNFNMTIKKDAREVIDKYYELNKLDDNSLNKLFEELQINVNVYFDGQNVKELNPGDIAKKYIHYYFKNELANSVNTIILYDQIENDVDKAFINDTIIGLIKDIRQKAQVILVTHDPIVAVNADPINYIEAIKDNKNKIMYRNFVPESDAKDELETIAKNVDGSKKVIKERYEIYRGDKNYVD